MSFSPDNFFKAFADSTRLRSLVLLQNQGELCVCELVHALDMSQPKISRHLAQLREAGIVSDRRQGLWVYYSLNPELPAWAKAVLKKTAAGVSQDSPYVEDAAALGEMPNRPGGRCCA